MIVERDLDAHGLPPLRGVIDLVRAGGCIVDFKTSARSPDKGLAALLHETQLATYALLYREATGKEESGFELQFLIKTKQPKLVVTSLLPVSPDQVRRLLRLMESYVAGVEAEDYIPSPGLHCSYCGSKASAATGADLHPTTTTTQTATPTQEGPVAVMAADPNLLIPNPTLFDDRRCFHFSHRPARCDEGHAPSLRCDHRADRDLVFETPTPSSTETWYPLAHRDLIHEVEEQLEGAGFLLEAESHALSREGNRYFGVFEVSFPDRTVSDYHWIVGLRNSHDKTFPAGLVAGTHVLCCDNLAFTGEVTISRKHTRHAVRDLRHLTSRAVGQLGDRFRGLDRRIEAYRTRAIGNPAAHDLIVKAIDCRAITPDQVPQVLQEWRKPSTTSSSPAMPGASSTPSPRHRRDSTPTPSSPESGPARALRRARRHQLKTPTLHPRAGQ